MIELPVERPDVSEERRARVLVCDDEPEIVRALKVLLREAGFETVVAETAEQALDRASVRPPDAAIIDLVCPTAMGSRYAAAPGVEPIRSSSCRRWARRTRRCARSGGSRRLRDEAVRAARARRPRRGGAAARRREPDEPTTAADGLEVDLAARVVAATARRST